MEQQAILALGTLTLVSCGAGLVFIHSSNPLLRGLNWMGCALLIGGVSTMLLLLATSFPPLQPLGNLCGFMAFMCCYRADQYLGGQQARIGSASKLSLTVLISLVPLQWVHLTGSRVSDTALSLAMAIQIETTARLLYRTGTGEERFPARFTAGMMRFLVISACFRAVLSASGALNDPRYGHPLQTLTYGLFISTSIALGFAFFWRTTTKLSCDLEHMASTDPLTRVYNRRVFLRWFEKELGRSISSGLPMSVLLLDFDHFKRINDTFGHHIGDEVLCAAVERIQDSIRGIDVLCRWGGEEFAVLLPNASHEATLIVAERIRQNIHSVNAGHERLDRRVASDFQLTVSIGAASYTHAGDGIEAMLQRADTALYQAKHSGRDRVILASSTASQPLASISPAALFELPMEGELFAKATP